MITRNVWKYNFVDFLYMLGTHLGCEDMDSETSSD